MLRADAFDVLNARRWNGRSFDPADFVRDKISPLHVDRRGSKMDRAGLEKEMKTNRQTAARAARTLRRGRAICGFVRHLRTAVRDWFGRGACLRKRHGYEREAKYGCQEDAANSDDCNHILTLPVGGCVPTNG